MIRPPLIRVPMPPGSAAPEGARIASVAIVSPEAIEGSSVARWASLPASAIQLHPHATVIVDEAAAAQLANLDYYRRAWQRKPAWQRL